MLSGSFSLKDILSLSKMFLIEIEKPEVWIQLSHLEPIRQRQQRGMLSMHKQSAA